MFTSTLSTQPMRRSLTVLVTAALTLCAAQAVAQDARKSQLDRGAYLTAIGGCGDCHTPLKMGPKGPEPDQSRALSGHPAGLRMPPAPKVDMPWGYVGSATNTAYAGPWGISYAINLTPDPETGLGKWTEQQFVQSIKTGRHLGVGRPVMPPMPWPAYANMTESDLKAIFAYLRTVKPIVNRVPDGQPAPPPKQAGAGAQSKKG